MFEGLTEKLGRITGMLRGQGRLTEEDVNGALREVRMALLEADVALPVVRDFVERVRTRALGEEVMKSLTPGQAVIRIVRDELIAMMGPEDHTLNLNTQPPAVVLMAGLQGTGKTTSVAKLGRWLRENQRKKVLVASCDVYRPAAIEQLRVLAAENGLEFFEADATDPIEIAVAALHRARTQFADVLIVDSAGRLHVDAGMMTEIRSLHDAIHPTDTLFVADSMTGQDAVNAAQAFNEALPLSGLVLTKTDGDARGGAVLSVRSVTGKPILFMGTGEKSEDLSPFHAERVVSRILGMGDVLSLIEEVERKTDQTKAAELARKIKKGKGFDLEDFRDQLAQMRAMGGIGGLLDKLPGMNQVPPGMVKQVNDRELVRLEAIIGSMTPAERRKPDLINGSRKRRIAAGSGTQIQDVNRLLKQFTQMQKMMKRFAKKGMANMLRGLAGGMPRGFRP